MGCSALIQRASRGTFLTHEQTTVYGTSRTIRELGEAAEWRLRLWASASPMVSACGAA